VKLIYEPAVRLVTGNGPQAIDALARKIRSIVSTLPVLSVAGTVAPAATHSPGSRTSHCLETARPGW
jgi:hypothetical protein